jgi:hypothetical protein
VPIIEELTPEYWKKREREWSEYFPGALFGWGVDLDSAVLEEFQAALSDGREESIQKALTAHPYLIQYAIERSGHHGIWAFPKQMIRLPAADGTPGLIPDYLVVTRSSLGYFWHVLELKRFDVQFSNSDGTGYSPEGHKGIAQCNSYLGHFQDYIDTVRSSIRVPELIQPTGAILLIGNSETESDAQQKCRANFVRNNPKIDVVSYQRILGGLISDLKHFARR